MINVYSSIHPSIHPLIHPFTIYPSTLQQNHSVMHLSAHVRRAVVSCQSFESITIVTFHVEYKFQLPTFTVCTWSFAAAVMVVRSGSVWFLHLKLVIQIHTDRHIVLFSLQLYLHTKSELYKRRYTNQSVYKILSVSFVQVVMRATHRQTDS